MASESWMSECAHFRPQVYPNLYSDRPALAIFPLVTLRFVISPFQFRVHAVSP